MKINLAVFFGGRSVEHEVSVITGVQAMMNLDKEKYNIIPVYMAKDGTFYSDDCLTDIDNYKDIDNLTSRSRKVCFVCESSKPIMKYSKKFDFTHKNQIEIDVALPCVHGTFCEDGSLQGFFELLNIPYATSNVCASAVGMDKSVFKKVMSAAELPVLPCIEIDSRRYSENSDNSINAIESQIGYPVIVKPANLGSSVGISKANDKNELIDSISLAFSFAENIIVEKCVENLKEINCAVLGDAGDCFASVCEAPAMSGDILSYDDKYTSGGKQSKGMASLLRKIPADIPDEISDKIKHIACRAFCAMGASGVCRIDFLLDTKTNQFYINEANTVPGSLAFYLFEASGIKYSELLDKLIDTAYKKSRRVNRLMHTIDVNLLSSNALSGNKFQKTGKIGK